MTRKVATGFLALIIAAALPALCQSAQQPAAPHIPSTSQPESQYKPTAEEAELIGLSREWMDAAIRHDWAKLDRIMAPEFTLQIWDASRAPQPRDKWLETLRNRLTDWKSDYTAISARVFGNVGVVYSRYRWSGKLDGKPFNDGGLMIDVWQKHKGKWRVVARRSAGQQQIQKVQSDLQGEGSGPSANK